MGRKSRKNEGPRTTKPSTTHRQDPPPGPTTTESATAEAAEAVEAGSEEATAHAASPPVAKRLEVSGRPSFWGSQVARSRQTAEWRAWSERAADAADDAAKARRLFATLFDIPPETAADWVASAFDEPPVC